jgi:HEAT repeat protein
MSKSRVFARTAVCCAMVLMMVVLLSSIAAHATDGGKNEEGNMEAQLASPERAVRDKAVNAVLAERKELIERLLALAAKDGKNSDDTRIAAIYLLGELRAEEAAPLLAKALTERLGRDIFIGGRDRYDMPVHVAIRKIGRPAIRALIENVEKSDDVHLRRQSLMLLANLVGGRQSLLGLLGRLQDRAEDEKVKARVAEAIEYVTERITGDALF